MSSLGEFWNLVKRVWTEGVLGVDIGTLLVAAAALLALLFLRRLFTRFVIGWMKRAAKRSRTELDDALVATLEAPIRFIPVVMGIFFATEILNPQGDLAALAEKLIRSLISFTIFWSLYRAIAPVLGLFKGLEKVFSKTLVAWLTKAMRIVAALIGAATILEIWGIQVGPIIAGLGLFGVAVALGAQDLFKNLISGLLVLAEKRFQVGDWIKVDGVVEGTVETIGFRSTMVRRFDKAPVFVPNAKLSDNALTNFSAMSHRRIYWKIGLVYSTGVEQLKAIRAAIEDFVLSAPEYAKPPEVSTFVRVDSFNESSIDLMLYCFTTTTNWGEWLEIKERLAYRVKQIVAEHGSDFAFPSQSVYIETVPGGTPEPFTPPQARAAAASP